MTRRCAMAPRRAALGQVAVVTTAPPLSTGAHFCTSAATLISRGAAKKRRIKRRRGVRQRCTSSGGQQRQRYRHKIVAALPAHMLCTPALLPTQILGNGSLLLLQGVARQVALGQLLLCAGLPAQLLARSLAGQLVGYLRCLGRRLFHSQTRFPHINSSTAT